MGKVMLGNIECKPIQESDEFNGRTYEQGRMDRELELEKAFKKLYGSECSWSEVILLADKNQ